MTGTPILQREAPKQWSLLATDKQVRKSKSSNYSPFTGARKWSEWHLGPLAISNLHWDTRYIPSLQLVLAQGRSDIPVFPQRLSYIISIRIHHTLLDTSFTHLYTEKSWIGLFQILLLLEEENLHSSSNLTRSQNFTSEPLFSLISIRPGKWLCVLFQLYHVILF